MSDEEKMRLNVLEFVLKKLVDGLSSTQKNKLKSQIDEVLSEDGHHRQYLDALVGLRSHLFGEDDE